MGAKGAFAPPVFIFLFQPKVFHCLLENLTKKTHYLLWVFKNLPPLNFELSPLLDSINNLVQKDDAMDLFNDVKSSTSYNSNNKNNEHK
jgi:hypothetical protein